MVGVKKTKPTVTKSKPGQTKSKASPCERGRPKVKPAQRKRSLQEDENDEPAEGEIECKVAGSVCRKWKTLTPATRSYTQQLVNNSVSSVLSQLNPDDFEDAEEVLNDLKSRFAQSLETMKAPMPIHSDYSKLKAKNEALTAELAHNQTQAEHMEEAIQRLESASEKYE